VERELGGCGEGKAGGVYEMKFMRERWSALMWIRWWGMRMDNCEIRE